MRYVDGYILPALVKEGLARADQANCPCDLELIGAR